MLLKDATKKYIEHMETIDRSKETIKGYTIELNLLNRYLSRKYNVPIYLEDITLSDLEDYLQMLKRKGNAPASRSRVVDIIRSFYKFCSKEDYIEKNISIKLETIPVPQKERCYLSAQEMEELLRAIDSKMVKLIVQTLYQTGTRISECLNLKLEDIDMENGVITVKNTKSKHDRRIPISDILHALLADYLKNWRTGKLNPYLFSLNDTIKVSPDYVNKKLHEAVKKLGWSKHVTCHILRHSFASNLVLKKVDIVIIQKLLGHTDLSTTSIYTHVNLEDLKQAVNLI